METKRKTPNLLVNLIYLFFVLFIIGFNVYSYVTPHTTDGFYSKDYVLLNDDWTITDPSGSTREQVHLPYSTAVSSGDVLVASHVLPDDLSRNRTLMLKSFHQNIDVYADDQLIFRYTYSDHGKQPVNNHFPPSRYFSIPLSQDLGGKLLTIRYTITLPNYAGQISSIYIGDELSIIYRIILNSILFLLAGVILILASFVLVIPSLLRGHNPELPRDTFYTGIYLFFLGFWFLAQVDSRQVFFQNLLYIRNMEFFSLMMLPVPILLSIDELERRQYHRITVRLCLFISAVNAVLTVLALTGVFPLLQMLKIIQGLIALALAHVILSFLRLQNDRPAIYREVRFSIILDIIFSLFAILELLVMAAGIDRYQGTFITIGSLIFGLGTVITTSRKSRMEYHALQARKAQNEAKNAFLANVTHELRTPINAILGMDEIILRDCKDTEILQHASDINIASHNLMSLVNDILDFSRMEANQFRIIDSTYSVTTLIQECLSLIQLRAKRKGLLIEVDINPQLPSTLYGDEIHIRQILVNLLTNAVKYTPQGFVRFSLSFKQPENSENGKNLILVASVTDSGIGISEEDQTKIFSSFTRVNESSTKNIEGSGLGLSIVQHLLKLMDGTISVSSVPHAGSCFTVEIPQTMTESSKPIGVYNIASIERDIRISSTSKNSFTAPEAHVLIVDDSQMNLRMIRLLLANTQMIIDTAESGFQCLQLAKEQKYDLIFMDYRMPEMDGIATFRKLRENPGQLNASTPVVMLTAQAAEESAKEILAEGFCDYITKPIEYECIDACLRKHLPEALIQLKNKDTLPEEIQEPEDTSISAEDIFRAIPAINLETGLKYCMNDITFYLEMVDEFLKADRRSVMRSLYEAEEQAAYMLHIHSLKSAALTVGAVTFSNNVKTLERRIRELHESMEDCKADHLALMDEYDQIYTALEKARKICGEAPSTML